MSAPISQSEVDSFLSCRRKHYYSFGEKLQSKRHGDGLNRGIIGHDVLATYYKLLISGVSANEAADQALSRLHAPEIAIIDNIPVILGLRTLLRDYFNFYEDEVNDWEFLAVEKEFRWEDFPFKPDLVKRNRKTGKVFVVDHKFLYNFYNPGMLDIMPQLAKYTGALRRLGFQVAGAEYNMLRHRSNAQEKFKRLAVSFTDTRIDTFIREQKILAEKIRELKSGTLEEWERKSVRTASSFNCQHCPFLSLCTTDVNGYTGRDLLVRMAFEPNTYGYTSEVEE